MQASRLAHAILKTSAGIGLRKAGNGDGHTIYKLVDSIHTCRAGVQIAMAVACQAADAYVREAADETDVTLSRHLAAQRTTGEIDHAVLAHRHIVGLLQPGLAATPLQQTDATQPTRQQADTRHHGGQQRDHGSLAFHLTGGIADHGGVPRTLIRRGHGHQKTVAICPGQS